MIVKFSVSEECDISKIYERADGILAESLNEKYAF